MIPLQADLNRTRVAFLLNDLDLAFTFMDLAETSRLEETKCNRQNARRVYDTVTAFLPKVTVKSSERQVIENGLRLLRARLEAAGSRF
jgi:hypothetical protein